MAKLTTIEGLGPVMETKLNAAGITSVENLLAEGGTKVGRSNIATISGIDQKKILEFVNRADLMRIKGVGEEWSDLLEAAGIDSVPELATRNTDNLHAKLVELNEQKKIVRTTPTLKQITDFVAQAKELPRAVHH